MALSDLDAELAVLEEAEQLLMAEAGFREWNPLPHQVPPVGDWWGWMVRAGRGSGKTDAASRFVYEHVMGPPCLDGEIPHRVALVAPTIGDAVETASRLPSSYKSHHPGGRLRTLPGGTIFEWPNGAQAKLFGAHTLNDVERLRAGGNNCVAHLEELAAWRYLVEAWQQVRFGLRVGPNPRWVASTTPKPRQTLRDIEARQNVVVSHASTDDNPHLHEGTKRELYEDYDGTTLGEQELEGKYLDRVEGALWTLAMIDDYRWNWNVWGEPALGRVYVGADPSGSATTGQTGIVAAGAVKGKCPCGHRPDQPHYAVVADCSKSGTAMVRARAIVSCFDTHDADKVVGERNYGGDNVEALVKEASEGSDRVPYEHVNATRGKQVRAEPVSTAYEQGRVHHLDVFPQLEDQQTTWEPDAGWSPDRLDALVWAVTKLQDKQRRRRARTGKHQSRLPEAIG